MTLTGKFKTIAASLCVISMMCATTPPVLAADFTFKRVKVNKNHKGPRINIQIIDDRTKPKVKEEPSASAPKEEPSAPTDLQDWFWTGVSPDLDAADFKRMNAALAQMGRNQSKKSNLSPSKQAMEQLITTYGKDMLIASLGKKVSPALLLAVMSVESGGKIDATSSAGAQGLMQLIPATAKRFNVKDTGNSLDNITGGAAYLDWLLSEFRYDPLLTLAGYNAGEGAVKKHNGIPPYPETRNYVPKVVAAWDVARSLCKTQPLLVTDPCVFKSQ